MNITDKAINYDAVCAIDGVDPIASLPYPSSKTDDEVAINSFAKVIRINRVLNEGWQPDWNDDDQYKYYPWFDMEAYGEDAGSGVGFSFNDYYYDDSLSYVGSRLVYPTRELAKFAGETFLAEYRGFMVIEK